jgi:divalent metal cation (Fe/Co/Zn/Cd) transporter
MDPIIAILVALFIVYEAYEMLVKAFNPLLDTAISDKEIQKIIQAIEDNILCTYNYSELKTRKSGALNHIQFVLSTVGETHLEDACKARNILRQKIIDSIPNSEVIVVLESAKFEPFISKDKKTEKE